MATWEDLEALRQRFPSAPAWGQAGSLQGGVLLPFLRLTLIQLGLGAHLGPSSQTCVYPVVSGFGPSIGVSELAPACVSRCRVPCLRGKKEQSSGMYEQTQQLSQGVICPPTEFPLFLSRTLPLIRSSLLGS